MKSKYLEICSIILLFIVMLLIIINVPIVAKYRNNGELIINEVVPNNRETYVNLNKEHFDYIELYNGYDYDINLSDYYLSDDNFNLRKWKFPDVVIEAKSYLLVFASGLDKYENGEIHTNFKLNSKGEVLTLSDSDTKVLSKIYFIETAPDTSYGYNGSKYVYFYNPTPLNENSKEYEEDPIEIEEESTIKLRISNYSIEKESKLDIVNDDDHDINLENFYLSNEKENKYKYRLPSVSIEPGKSITIYADGLDKYEDDIVHTNFKLNNSRVVILSDNYKREIDNVTIYDNKELVKDIRVNEVSFKEIELKNLTDSDINLSGYSISDNSGVTVNLKDTINANSYLVLNVNNLGFGINNSDEVIYLYKNNKLIDSYSVGRLIDGISSGINDSGNRVFYKDITMNSNNSSTYYLGYSSGVSFSKDGGYANSGDEITLKTNDNSTIYYTLDGSFPSNNSTKYSGPIKISKTTVIKTITYKDNYLPSDIESRTYIVGNKHDLPIISISSNYSYLFGDNGIISNYHQNSTRKINFEYYESDGKLGVSFVGDTKLSGMDSRERNQKSMSIFLRKEYGLKEVTYPFFPDSKVKTYSSFLLRNSGEDPKSIRIMDAVLTQSLKENMDIDIQDYRPVVVYINGEYWGLYNLREKLNDDYIVTNYGLDKDDIDLVKYKIPSRGSVDEYNQLVDYIANHDVTKKEVYEYVESKLDIQELINYVIVQAYYGNTDLGNIRYWKDKDNGKWRFMLYDLDWSLWDTSRSFSYPVFEGRVPAATYLYSVYAMTRKLYKNSDFRDLYLKTVAYHLKNTFKPERMNTFVDKYSDEIRSEIPNHIKRWGDGPRSMDQWESNLNRFKGVLENRYNVVVSRLKSEFNLTQEEYNKYFGDL